MSAQRSLQDLQKGTFLLGPRLSLELQDTCLAGPLGCPEALTRLPPSFRIWSLPLHSPAQTGAGPKRCPLPQTALLLSSYPP